MITIAKLEEVSTVSGTVGIIRITPFWQAAYPLFGIRLSPHPLQFIVMSHLRVQFVLHLFKEVGATVAFPAFDVRIEAVAVFGLHTEKGIEDRSKLFQRSLAAIDAAGGVDI